MRILKLFCGRNLMPAVAMAVITVSFFSCKVERIAILKDIPDTANVRYVAMQNFTPPIVKPDDILNITIQTLDLQANQILNQGNLPILSGAVNSGSQNGQQTAVTGYLISKEGDVHMPYVGDVKVQGLTTDQVRLLITEKISAFFKDPVVNVRFANFRVSVLGEVKNPSTFLLPNEKSTLIEAIGLAGDITIYGRRDNILLIRDNNGQKELARINLDSSKSISSPYFYLRPNDVIYVEASASRVQSTDAYQNRNYAIIGAALSLITIVAARLLFK